MSVIPVEERLAAIVASSDDAILSKDRDGLITSWNAGAQKLYGYTPEEAIGQPISILIPPHRQGEEREILDKILAGQRVDHYETERVRKDGQMLVISLVVSPLHADGETIGASVIARDVTERRRAEERAARLQRVTTELSRVAVGSGETVDVVLREAVPAVGGDAGAVGLLERDGKTIRVAGYRGYSDASLAQWETFPLEADTPMSEAIRNDQPFWSTDTGELKRRYPALAEAEIDFSSLAVIPLAVEAEAFGALAVSFKEPHRFEP